MPKINVYLPDDLAENVKTANLPVSAICQRALEQSVRRVTAIRQTVLGELDDPTAQLSQFTDRAKTVIKIAIARAAEDGSEVGTEHLLHGLLAEGANLALQVLRAVEIDPARIQLTLPAGEGEPQRFSSAAANALELTVTEAISLGHNYVGCEHLLIGLVAEPDGAAGIVLRGLGVELKAIRATVVAALTGYTHLRAQTPDPMAVIAAVVTKELKPLVDRVEKLEQRLGS